MDFARRRRTGYLTALKDAGFQVDHALMRSEEMTEPYGYISAREMLRLKNAPTAFVASSYIVALGIRRAVEELGLKLVRDISIITHDDDLSYLGNQGDVPVFTATRSSVRAAGRRCAEILLTQIESGDRTPVQDLWESQLMVGLSTGPRRGTAS